ncbi:hypothetical protein B0H12DRAFT_1082905 [Mycena haematopus]|nr:hypothetical protein B0H12DRAFT_1082905 [Mycena haematopus]
MPSFDKIAWTLHKVNDSWDTTVSFKKGIELVYRIHLKPPLHSVVCHGGFHALREGGVAEDKWRWHRNGRVVGRELEGKGTKTSSTGRKSVIWVGNLPRDKVHSSGASKETREVKKPNLPDSTAHKTEGTPTIQRDLVVGAAAVTMLLVSSITRSNKGEGYFARTGGNFVDNAKYDKLSEVACVMGAGGRSTTDNEAVGAMEYWELEIVGNWKGLGEGETWR